MPPFIFISINEVGTELYYYHIEQRNARSRPMKQWGRAAIDGRLSPLCQPFSYE